MQKAKKFKGVIKQKVGLDYLLYLPKGYKKGSEKKLPLIMFLHGMGERGDDLELVKKHGPAKLVENRDLEFIVVSPQCPPDSFWPAETAVLNALIDEIVDKHDVDVNRIYLTGLSMGGYGTWHLAVEYPERFAAIAPVCGGAMFYANLAEKIGVLKDVPVWAFHGARDRTVDLAESADLVHTLEQAGGKVKFTIYPSAEHDSWSATYSNLKLYKWFLRHSKAGKKSKKSDDDQGEA
jgi:predicted peptidase